MTKSGTLYANWTKDANQRVTLHFDTQGGSGLLDKEVLKNAELLLGDFPTTVKSGYSFSGWSLDGTTVLTYPLSFNQNQTLSAVWEKDSNQWLMIIFDSKGGFAIANQHLINGTTVANANLPIPDYYGYTFGGWSWTDGGVALQDTDTLTQSGTLYALWTQDLSQWLSLTYDLQ